MITRCNMCTLKIDHYREENCQSDVIGCRWHIEKSCTSNMTVDHGSQAQYSKQHKDHMQRDCFRAHREGRCLCLRWQYTTPNIWHLPIKSHGSSQPPFVSTTFRHSFYIILCFMTLSQEITWDISPFHYCNAIKHTLFTTIGYPITDYTISPL